MKLYGGTGWSSFGFGCARTVTPVSLTSYGGLAPFAYVNSSAGEHMKASDFTLQSSCEL